jgi:hypothetical protein
LATKSEFSSSAITIDIHLLDPGVDRSMAELEECRLEWSWISIRTSGGRGRDSESVQSYHQRNISSPWPRFCFIACILDAESEPICYHH